MLALNRDDRGSHSFHHPEDMQNITHGSFSSVHIHCWAVVSIRPLHRPSHGDSATDKTPTLSALVTTVILLLWQSQLNGWCVPTSCSHQTAGLFCKGQEALVHRRHGYPPGVGAEETCTGGMDTQPDHCSSIFDSLFFKAV